MSEFNNNLKELSDDICSTLNKHLDFISEINESNPQLANILLLDFAFHLKMLKNLSKLKLKKED